MNKHYFQLHHPNTNQFLGVVSCEGRYPRHVHDSLINGCWNSWSAKPENKDMILEEFVVYFNKMTSNIATKIKLES